eukprot:TRINITY_DN5036_c0_g1_i2.p1 TRINITY_DN5036_c0_g1~~TRINITY_DN5036_c0_g1_i2.p1  ORF type:complete len:121 (-),score=41.72 TRINITY_DN5036_c0_g1_i2:46-408(-)
MGCCGSTTGNNAQPAPRVAAPVAQPYTPPKPPTAEEIAARKHEEEEERRWLEQAKRTGPAEPPPAVLPPGASQEQYKEYMRVKYEHEAWENQVLLLSRRLRAQASAGGATSSVAASGMPK